jgi:hypothetical protein
MVVVLVSRGEPGFGVSSAACAKRPLIYIAIASLEI